MNLRAMRAIYVFEMARTGRTLLQSIVSPVVSTSLYFVVFGAAIGSRITEIDGVAYGAFIVPGLIMLLLLTQSVMNASFGIYFPRFTGTIYEILSAPVSYLEIVIGYAGAAATKSIILGLVVLATSGLLIPLRIAHPVWMIAFLVLTAVTFSLFGFILGLWADGFENGRLVQPGGLSHQRLPLELLRDRRRERSLELGDDGVVPRHLPGDGMVDLQDRLPTQELVVEGSIEPSGHPQAAALMDERKAQPVK